MMLRRLREELGVLLEDDRLPRKFSLRRCDEAEALFICDLPLFAPADVLSHLRIRLEESGWSITEKNGRWLLDHSIPVPPRFPLVCSGGEAACCLSLLRRHPMGTANAEDIRLLLKVMDGPKDKQQMYFRRLHGALAEKLRLHQPLPMLLPYLEYELNETEAAS